MRSGGDNRYYDKQSVQVKGDEKKDIKTQTKYSDLLQPLCTMLMKMKWRIKPPPYEAVTFREDQNFLRDKSIPEYSTRVVSMEFRVMRNQPYACINDEKQCTSIWSVT